MQANFIEILYCRWEDRFRFCNEILGKRPWDELQVCQPRKHPTMPNFYANRVDITPIVGGQLPKTGWREPEESPTKPEAELYAYANIEVFYGPIDWADLEESA